MNAFGLGDDNLNTNHSNNAKTEPENDIKKLSGTFTKTRICDNDTSADSEELGSKNCSVNVDKKVSLDLLDSSTSENQF